MKLWIRHKEGDILRKFDNITDNYGELFLEKPSKIPSKWLFKLQKSGDDVDIEIIRNIKNKDGKEKKKIKIKLNLLPKIIK